MQRCGNMRHSNFEMRPRQDVCGSQDVKAGLNHLVTAVVKIIFHAHYLLVCYNFCHYGTINGNSNGSIESFC